MPKWERELADLAKFTWNKRKRDKLKNIKRVQLTKSSRMSQIHINDKTELKEQITVLGITESYFIFEEM